MMPCPTLSVCIVTFNSGDTIGECLKSVGEQRGIDIEAIVVDNASSDDGPERAEEFPFCRVIRNLRNRFFARANNQALLASRGEYVLILNPDTELEVETAAVMIQALRERPDVGAAICTIVGDSPSGAPEVPHWWKRRATRDLVTSLQPWLWWHEWRSGLAAASDPDAGARDVDVISDACLFGRRAAIEQIGWYDERYHLYFTEDDLCHRLWEAGWRVCYLPFARVRHHGSSSTRKAPRLWLRWLTIQDLLVYAWRHLGATAFLLVAMAGLLDLALVAVVRGAKWLAGRVFSARGAPNVAA